MLKLIDKVSARLKEYQGSTVGIAVSGGRDSMCLLHSCLKCGSIPKSQLVVIHVNHNLRKTAQRDEKFVRQFCVENCVKFIAFSVDVNSYAQNNGLTVEQAARNLRYDKFHKLINSGEVSAVMTAHHALDNAETVLMHMFRGSGIDGLKPMRSDEFVRPLIDVYPDEIDEYAIQNGIEYVVDETNLVDDADRNFIRLNVLPLIEKRYKGAVKAINALSNECKNTCELLDGMLDDNNVVIENGTVIIKNSAFNDSVLAARYVRRAMSNFTLTDLTRPMIERVIELFSMRTGATVELPFGVAAVREYDGVALFVPRKNSLAECTLKVGANYIDGLVVDLLLSDSEKRFDFCNNAKTIAENCGGNVKNFAVKNAVDLDKVLGATIRFRRNGDIFTPYGGKSKKLKQYLTDKKFPARVKDRLPLICRDNEVLAIVGVEISDTVKVSADTKNIAILLRRY